MAQVDRGDQQNRKDDTVLLVDVASSVTTDLGNYLTNLTASASWAYETGNSRTQLTTNREITVQFDADTGSSGMLIWLGDTDASDWYASVQISGNKVLCRFNNGGGATTVFDEAPPNLGASLRTYTVQWCTRPNPLTTGASDAQLSELIITDHDTADSYAGYRKEHADIAPTISAAHACSYGMRWNGASELTKYTDTIAWVRVGARFHSTTEAVGDWVAGFSDPVNDGVSYVQPPPLPSRIGEDGEFAGPPLLAALDAHRRNSLRLLSPIVNEVYKAPVEMQDNLLDVVHDGLVLTVDTDFQAHQGLVRCRPVPQLFGDFRVSVSGQLWLAAPGAPDQVEVRIYSANYRPGFPVNNPKVSSLTLTFTDDDTSAGPPTWKRGRLRCNRTDDGEWTYLWVAFRHNAGSATANNRFKFWGWSVEPLPIPLAADEDIPPIQLPP